MAVPTVDHVVTYQLSDLSPELAQAVSDVLIAERRYLHHINGAEDYKDLDRGLLRMEMVESKQTLIRRLLILESKA